MIGLGMQELIIILIIVAILFGATRLPELGRGIGQAVRNFRKGVSELNEVKKDVSDLGEEVKKDVSDLGKIDVMKPEEDTSKREEAKKEEEKKDEVKKEEAKKESE